MKQKLWRRLLHVAVRTGTTGRERQKVQNGKNIVARTTRSLLLHQSCGLG